MRFHLLSCQKQQHCKILLSFFQFPLGDFAIFVSSGLRFREALGLLCFCYLCSYAGILVGATLSASLNMTPWIFAVIAGMFLYVALAEMVSSDRIFLVHEMECNCFHDAT